MPEILVMPVQQQQQVWFLRLPLPFLGLTPSPHFRTILSDPSSPVPPFPTALLDPAVCLFDILFYFCTQALLPVTLVFIFFRLCPLFLTVATPHVEPLAPLILFFHTVSLTQWHTQLHTQQPVVVM